MPFNPTGSVVSTDLDNMLRGLYRDNSDSALTGTTGETTLKSFNLAANTVGATGGIYILIAGGSSGAGGTKTVRFKFGGTTPINLSVPAGSQNWFFECWLFNTAPNAQRATTMAYTAASGSGAPTFNCNGLWTAAVDTTANVTISVTGQLVSAGDTVTAQMFDILIIQIT